MGVKCADCSKFIGPRVPSLKCYKCRNWFHAMCLDVSADTIDYFLSEAKKDNGDQWICVECVATDSANPKEADLIAETIRSTLKDELNKRFDDFKKDFMSTIQRDFSAMNDRLDTLERENRMLREELLLVKNTSTSAQCVINEIEEQKFRSSNVMIFNLPEPVNSGSGTDRIAEDTAKLRQVFGTAGIDSVATKIIRVGKKNNSGPRPIKAVFENASIAKNILTKSKELNEKAHIVVKSDLTVKQQQFLNDLRSEMKRRCENGENLTIKFRHGSPVIVKKSENI